MIITRPPGSSLLYTDVEEEVDTGEVEALEDAGWIFRRNHGNCYYAPAHAQARDTHGELLAAFWRHVGTATLEDALLTFEVARRLGERWEADRHPGLGRALHTSWRDLVRSVRRRLELMSAARAGRRARKREAHQKRLEALGERFNYEGRE